VKAGIVVASPFFAIVSAGIFNLFFSRYKDFSSGINVSAVNPNGTKTAIPEEKSLYAAKKAFLYTAIIRASVPIPSTSIL
jgi:hypothetical protein